MTVALEGGEWSAAPPIHTLLPGKDPVPILQEAVWTPGPVWMGGKSRPHWDSILNQSARSQSLYPLSYLAHISRYTRGIQTQLNNQTTSTQHLNSCSIKFKYSQSIFNLSSQKHLSLFFEITIVNYCCIC